MVGGIAFWLKFWTFSVAGWVNQEQLQVIDYLKNENRTLRRAIKAKRIRLSLEDRRRLAVKGRGIGRKWLKEVATIACPDTILGWYRDLVAKKWTYEHKGKGRPRSRRDIREMIVRMAKENLTWGYTRILGALKNLGLKSSRGTIANVLKENGIEGAPNRGRRTPLLRIED
jgi:putative transposase